MAIECDCTEIGDIDRATLLAAPGIDVGGNGSDLVGALRETLPDGDDV